MKPTTSHLSNEFEIWKLSTNDSKRITCTTCGVPAMYGYTNTGGAPFWYVCELHKPNTRHLSNEDQVKANTLNSMGMMSHTKPEYLKAQANAIQLESFRVALAELMRDYHVHAKIDGQTSNLDFQDAVIESACKILLGAK